MHIPDDPAFYEKFYFTPGDLGYKVFDTKFGKIGVLICWDQWYPEASRITALMGSRNFILPYCDWLGYDARRRNKSRSNTMLGKQFSVHMRLRMEFRLFL